MQMNKKKCSIELKSKISPFAHKIVLVQMNIFTANKQKMLTIELNSKISPFGHVSFALTFN